MSLHVLVLCTHNSARSVLAETMLNHWARRLGRDVVAHSAGSAPGGRINPFAIEVLQAAGIATDGLRSKSWDEFSRADAPPLAIVITVCDSAAAEPCPLFHGRAGEAMALGELGEARDEGVPHPSSSSSASAASNSAPRAVR